MLPSKFRQSRLAVLSWNIGQLNVVKWYMFRAWLNDQFKDCVLLHGTVVSGQTMTTLLFTQELLDTEVASSSPSNAASAMWTGQSPWTVGSSMFVFTNLR